MLSIKTHLTYKDRDRLKIKGRRKICHADINEKKPRVVISISYKLSQEQGILSVIKKTLHNNERTFIKKRYSNS